MKRILKVISAALCVCIISSASVSAEVMTEKSATGPADTVYVAGNPDLYPIEYYDAESKIYKGIVPEMLRRVSDNTGISFTYVSAGMENEQKRLSRNNQVEIVTAVLSDDDECRLEEKYPVLTVKDEAGEKTYCIGFTQIASDDIKEAVKAALAQISEKEKTGLLMSYAMTNRAMPKIRFIFWICISFFSAILISLIVVLIVRRRKCRKERDINLTDTLTGIGNAEYYKYSFNGFITDQVRNLYNAAYIAFDAEKNENLWGKSICEDIEKITAEHLNSVSESGEYLSHLEKGVFVLMYQARSFEEADSRAGKLIAGLNECLNGYNRDWIGMFNEGVCRLCNHPDSNAESTLYNAKQAYIKAKNDHVDYYIGSSRQAMENRRRARLCAQMSESIEKGEFEIYMQFITESEKGEICGAEVLSRWQHSEYGLLRPHEYIELLKETGKIVEHDYHVFRNVCGQLEYWSSQPYKRLFLTCNFTRASVSREDFAEKIREISEKFSFDHKRLVIEITEDSVADNLDVVSSNIRQLSEMGFNIAIDDMGSGFSSLADLYDNEIDVVKIERDFLVSCSSERRLKMLQDIITLVHNTGARVICEGIEFKEQQEMLCNIGCDMLQGFYYSRVLPLSECERFLSLNHITEKQILGK